MGMSYVLGRTLMASAYLSTLNKAVNMEEGMCLPFMSSNSWL